MKKAKFGKKTVYSILAGIGLMGFATPIAFNIAKNNNYNVIQNKNINNTNFDDSSTTISNNFTTNNNVDIKNADIYNDEFLKDLNSYKNVDYTTTFDVNSIADINILGMDRGWGGSVETQKDTDASLGYNGDITDNSVLMTNKDENELTYEKNGNDSSNLFSTIKWLMEKYGNDYINYLSSEIKNVLINKYNNDFGIDSITPVVEYFWDKNNNINAFQDIDPNNKYIETDSNGNEWYYSNPNFGIDDSKGTLYWTIASNPFSETSLFDQLDSYYGNEWIYYLYSNSDFSSISNDVNVVDSNGRNYTLSAYCDSITNVYNKAFPNNSITNQYQQNSPIIESLTTPQIFAIEPFYDVSGNTLNSSSYFKNYTTKYITAQIDDPMTYYNINGYNHYVLETQLSPIINSIYNFEPNNNTQLASIQNSPGATQTINTFPNNTPFEGVTRPGNYNDYYRGLLQWTLTKLPTYSFNPNTLQLEITNNGVTYPIVDTNGNFVANNYNTTTQNFEYQDYSNPSYYVQDTFASEPQSGLALDAYIDGYNIGNPTYDAYINNSDLTNEKINSFEDYNQQRSNDELTIVSLYKDIDVQDLMNYINNFKKNFSVTDLNNVKQSVDYIFGTNNNFSLVYNVLPTTFKTNESSNNLVSVNQDAFGDNGGLIPKNTSIKFNNFLPVLANQIVIDPQSSESSYINNNSGNVNGIYTTANGIKFKLSENMGKLLSITNLYDKYYDQVNAINPSSYKETGLQNALTTFKNLFMKFAFRENNENAINDILTKLQSSSTINQDLVNEINSLDGNPNYVLVSGTNSSTSTQDQSSNSTTTYQDNVNEVVKLISEIFGVNSTNYIYNTDATNGNFFNENVRNMLVLLPTAVKNAMSNDIDADIDYGNGNIVKNQPIWDASKQQFITYNLDNTEVSDEMAANNESEVSFSNIHFADKNANTQDALYNAIDTKNSSNGMDFTNNGTNTNLNYMLDEYKQYYPNEDSITANNDSVTYKIKYNPEYSNWQQSTMDANYNDGIPITPEQDAKGYLATEYTMQDYSKYATDDVARGKLTNIITSISNFFASEKIQPSINLTNTSSDITVLNNNYNGAYVGEINQIKNDNGMDFSGDDNTGVFYVLAKIENSQNFPNPTGDNDRVVVQDKIWYVATDNANPQIKYYLIKMNAAKKIFDLSSISFDMSADASSKPTSIDWEINNTNDYYYSDTITNASQIYIQNGVPSQKQTINVNSNTYLEFQNDITNNSGMYYQFKSKISQWFNKYYGVGVNSMNITVNNGNVVINLELNN